MGELLTVVYTLHTLKAAARIKRHAAQWAQPPQSARSPTPRCPAAAANQACTPSGLELPLPCACMAAHVLAAEAGLLTTIYNKTSSYPF